MANAQQARPRQWWVLAGLLAVSVGVSQGLSWWQAARHATAVRQHAKAGDITMYTSTTCPYCAKAQAWLDGHGIPWRECNIDLDKACLRTFSAQGAPGTPLMWVKGQWHLGFDTAWLAQVLPLPAAPTVNGPAHPGPP